MTASCFIGGDLSDKGNACLKESRGRTFCVPRGNGSCLSLAKDTRSLDENYVVFKPFYFPFFHLLCNIKI